MSRLDDFARLSESEIRPGRTIFDEIEGEEPRREKKKAEEVQGFATNEDLINTVMELGALYRKHFLVWNSNKGSELRVYAYLTSTSSVGGLFEEDWNPGRESIVRSLNAINKKESELEGRLRNTEREWPIIRLCRENALSQLETRILYLLLYAANYVESSITLQDTVNIMRALGHSYEEVMRVFSSSPLVEKGIVEVRQPEFMDHKDPMKKHVIITARALDYITMGVEPRQASVSRFRQPRFTLNRIVLPKDIMEMLYLLAAQEKNSSVLFGEWGLGEVMGDDHRGLKLLFYGPPGTGKTATAEALAGEIGRGMIMADYPSIVNSYVGETIKNIKALFREASESGAVLVVDEADAIVSSRRPVTSAVDTELNRDVNVFLQELEAFDGVVILTTNFVDNLDPALRRRIHYVFNFPVPGEGERLKLWKMYMPEKLPVDEAVHPEILAKKYEITGADIKNAVIHAARLVLARMEKGERPYRITLDDIDRAVSQLGSSLPSRTASKDRKVRVDGYM